MVAAVWLFLRGHALTWQRCLVAPMGIALQMPPIVVYALCILLERLFSLHGQ